MSLFYISSWLTLKKTNVILQDTVQLTPSVQLQNYKNYTACLETLGRAINRPHHFWKNLFARVIYRPRTKYSLKGLIFIIKCVLWFSYLHQPRSDCFYSLKKKANVIKLSYKMIRIIISVPTYSSMPHASFISMPQYEFNATK